MDPKVHLSSFQERQMGDTVFEAKKKKFDARVGLVVLIGRTSEGMPGSKIKIKVLQIMFHEDRI